MNKVLLVEDDEFILELYQRALQKAGLEVDLATDGQKGLDLLKSTAYGLVLLDIMLPLINGIDILKELQKDPNLHKPPVYLLTNLAKDSIIEQGYKLGASGHILKAKITPTLLANAVKKFFETGKINSDSNGMLLNN